MPAHLREVIARWIDEGQRRDPPDVDARINARLVDGGPGGCSYLDANGEIWDCDLWGDDDTWVRMEDGPQKVSIIVWATELLPELAAWLPARPPNAVTCRLCAGTGKAPPIVRGIDHCWECVGLGWIIQE
jgi:hypothetical protein